MNFNKKEHKYNKTLTKAYEQNAKVRQEKYSKTIRSLSPKDLVIMAIYHPKKYQDNLDRYNLRKYSFSQQFHHTLVKIDKEEPLVKISKMYNKTSLQRR